MRIKHFLVGLNIFKPVFIIGIGIYYWFYW